jgi:hypothetical protein
MRLAAVSLEPPSGSPTRPMIASAKIFPLSQNFLHPNPFGKRIFCILSTTARAFQQEFL